MSRQERQRGRTGSVRAAASPPQSKSRGEGSEGGQSPPPRKVITIDGPAGAGKTTTARALADRLGYRLVDTGAMYRALAWSLVQKGLLGADDTLKLRRHLDSVEIELRDSHVYV